MKQAGKLNNEAIRLTNKTMFQPLESRCLMSLAAAVEFQPAMAAPPVPMSQIHHSFGFEAQMGQAAPDMSSMHPEMPTADPRSIAGTEPANLESLKTQFIHAIANGMDLSIVAAGAPANISMANQAVSQLAPFSTLSGLYATIGSSTVAEIDRANAADQLLDSVNSPGDAGTATVVSNQTVPASSQVPASEPPLPLARTAATSTSAADTVISVTADVQPGASPQSTLPPTDPLSRKMLESMEQELRTIRGEASELVLNLGRERTIETAHKQELFEPSVTESPLHRSRSTAATVGAAIAAAVYAQIEIVKGKRKVNARFSQQLIQPV